jgi:hypothetical protein
MPAGSLNENAVDSPMCGVPARDQSSRMSEWMSVTVPTVERLLPPSRFWSTTTEAGRLSTASTSGLPKLGSRLRTNAVWVWLSCRCDSAAMVSNTSEDLPEPDTPVTTVSRPAGTVTSTLRRLCSRAPVTVIMLSTLTPVVDT